jgi:hypothetical protein
VPTIVDRALWKAENILTERTGFPVEMSNFAVIPTPNLAGKRRTLADHFGSEAQALEKHGSAQNRTTL